MNNVIINEVQLNITLILGMYLKAAFYLSRRESDSSIGDLTFTCNQPLKRVSFLLSWTQLAPKSKI